MFQRMEPPSEGTDGQGGQGVNGLPSTQPDNINSMWVDMQETGTWHTWSNHMKQQNIYSKHPLS